MSKQLSAEELERVRCGHRACKDLGEPHPFCEFAKADEARQPQPECGKAQANSSFSNANQLLNEQPSAAQDAAEYTLERDLMGAMHIKWGDFDFIQIQYQWPYTDNASTRRLAERIVELLSAPAHPAPRNEQAGAWIACSERLPNKVEWCLVFADGAMNCMAFNNGNWEDWVSAALPNIRAGDVTHWMPLPAAPALSQQADGGVKS